MTFRRPHVRATHDHTHTCGCGEWAPYVLVAGRQDQFWCCLPCGIWAIKQDKAWQAKTPAKLRISIEIQ